jgi:hypothetical protein
MDIIKGHKYLAYRDSGYTDVNLLEIFLLEESLTSFKVEITQREEIRTNEKGTEDKSVNYRERFWVLKSALIHNQPELQVNQSVRSRKYGNVSPYIQEAKSPILYILIEDLSALPLPVDQEPKTLNDQYNKVGQKSLNETYSDTKKQVQDNIPQGEIEDESN